MTSLTRTMGGEQDIGAYLREIAAVAGEAANTSNPKVHNESLRLLIKQIEQLRAICTEELRQQQ
jgi:hypothetical protein